MRRPIAVSGVLFLVFAAAACGHNEQAAAGDDALCSPAYQPRELVEHGPSYVGLSAVPGPAPATDPANETRTTDAAAIRKIAAAVCALPVPPRDVACTLELGPRYELRFVDTQGRTTNLSAESYGCQFVEGLATRRYDAKPLWDALAAAGLPAPRRG